MSRVAKPAPIAVRYDPNPEHFVLTKYEFERLCEVAKIPERENVMFLLGLLIPCAISIVGSLPVDTAKLTVPLVLNFTAALVFGLLCIFQGRGWYGKRKQYRSFVSELKTKPPGELTYSRTPTSPFVNDSTTA